MCKWTNVINSVIIKEEIEKIVKGKDIFVIAVTVCMYAHMHGTLQLYTCMHLYVCACIFACMLAACDYKMLCHAEKNHCFIAQDLNKQKNKMSTEKKDLKWSADTDHSFSFNSKVSNIVDDYLFKETVKSGLKRKREPENIVGTKKSKKRLRRL